MPRAAPVTMLTLPSNRPITPPPPRPRARGTPRTRPAPWSRRTPGGRRRRPRPDPPASRRRPPPAPPRSRGRPSRRSRPRWRASASRRRGGRRGRPSRRRVPQAHRRLAELVVAGEPAAALHALRHALRQRAVREHLHEQRGGVAEIEEVALPRPHAVPAVAEPAAPDPGHLVGRAVRALGVGH